MWLELTVQNQVDRPADGRSRRPPARARSNGRWGRWRSSRSASARSSAPASSSGRRPPSPTAPARRSSLAFIVAGVGCAFAGLCYAEFASMIPVAGSAYTYSYATMGEFVAWIIGWDLVLEYAVGAATVAIAWSEYLEPRARMVRAAHTVPMVAFAVRGRCRPAVHGIMNVPAVVILAAAHGAADPRHQGVGVRQRHHRHRQGLDRR